MPVAHVGLSRGPRPFPNGFRTGRTTTATPTTPPVFLHQSDFVVDSRTALDTDNRTSHVTSSKRSYAIDNRTRYVVQS